MIIVFEQVSLVKWRAARGDVNPLQLSIALNFTTARIIDLFEKLSLNEVRLSRCINCP